MNHFDIHFSFVQFLKTLPVLLKVSASKFFFFFSFSNQVYIKKKKIPTRYSATRKDPIIKVTYLKRGHLCKRNLSSGVEVCKQFGVPLSTETQHCPWRKKRGNQCNTMAQACALQKSMFSVQLLLDVFLNFLFQKFWAENKGGSRDFRFT